MARLTIWWLSRVFNDAVVEITITLASTYFTYYVGDELLGVSGVLAVVTLGVEINARRTHISPEVEAFLLKYVLCSLACTDSSYSKQHYTIIKNPLPLPLTNMHIMYGCGVCPQRVRNHPNAKATHGAIISHVSVETAPIIMFENSCPQTCKVVTLNRYVTISLMTSVLNNSWDCLG